MGPNGEPGPVIGDMSIFLRSAAYGPGRDRLGVPPEPAGPGVRDRGRQGGAEFAFTEIGAHRVFAEVDPRNAASVGLCQRLGMRLEGIFVENEIFKGEWADLAVYAILDREWAEGR